MRETERLLEEHLRRREPEYFELLRRMVAVNSFTTNLEGIAEKGRLTAEIFAELGFADELVPSRDPEYGAHLVLTREAPAGPAAPKVGLVSHLDTVFPPEEEERHDFAWREEGERVYGPGTVDIKGGTVVVYMMLDALRGVAPEVYDAVSWHFFLNSAEEREEMGFGPLVLERLGGGGEALACLVFEGGQVEGERTKLVVARKGMCVYEVEVEGRASHAGSGHPHGASAILEIADVIRRIESWTDYESDLTLNVGSVHGGTVTNRVPHKAVARGEMRAFRSEVYDAARAKVLALGESAHVRSPEDGYPCTVRLEILQERGPWAQNPATEHLFEVWHEAASSLGLEAVREERGGLSDGNQLWATVPTLDGLGPSGGNAHCSERAADGSKDQEYADRPSFVTKALLNASALLRLIDRG